MTFKDWKRELRDILAREMGRTQIGEERLQTARDYFDRGLSPRDFYDDSFVAGLPDSVDSGFDPYEEGILSR